MQILINLCSAEITFNLLSNPMPVKNQCQHGKVDGVKHISLRLVGKLRVDCFNSRGNEREEVMNTLTMVLLTQVALLLGMLPGFGSGGSEGRSGPSNSGSTMSTETVQKTLRVSSGTLILLDTEYGDVAIRNYDGDNVKVELKMEGTGTDVSNFRFTHDYFENQVTLKAWYEKEKGRQSQASSKVSFLILVPRDSSYAFQTVTGLGNIDADISANTKSADLSTEMGSVSVKIPRDYQADIDAVARGMGSVVLSPAELICEPCFKCDINRADRLKGKMHGGGQAINAQASIGSVYFQVMPY